MSLARVREHDDVRDRDDACDRRVDRHLPERRRPRAGGADHDRRALERWHDDRWERVRDRPLVWAWRREHRSLRDDEGRQPPDGMGLRSGGDASRARRALLARRGGPRRAAGARAHGVRARRRGPRDPCERERAIGTGSAIRGGARCVRRSRRDVRARRPRGRVCVRCADTRRGSAMSGERRVRELVRGDAHGGHHEPARSPGVRRGRRSAAPRRRVLGAQPALRLLGIADRRDDRVPTAGTIGAQSRRVRRLIVEARGHGRIVVPPELELVDVRDEPL